VQLQDYTSMIQAIASVMVVITIVVSWRQMKIQNDQLALQNAQLADVQQSRSMQMLLEVIKSLLDIRPEIESVLRLKEKPLVSWTEEERNAALLVCSRFQLVGILVLNGVIPEKLFAQAWYFSVVNCHKAVEPFLDEIRRNRHQNYWRAFDELVTRVKSFEPNFGAF
jgi:hypothetical protein